MKNRSLILSRHSLYLGIPGGGMSSGIMQEMIQEIYKGEYGAKYIPKQVNKMKVI